MSLSIELVTPSLKKYATAAIDTAGEKRWAPLLPPVPGLSSCQGPALPPSQTDRQLAGPSVSTGTTSWPWILVSFSHIEGAFLS